MVVQYNALICGREHRAMIVELMNQKEVVGDLFNQLRLALQRRNMGRPAQVIIFFLFFFSVLWLLSLNYRDEEY